MAKRGRKAWNEGMTLQDLASILDNAPKTHNGYVMLRVNNKNMMVHRFVWDNLVGPIPRNHEIDHINGIRHDCRLENLRCVNRTRNMRNSAKQTNNTSGITGVNKVKIQSNLYWAVTWNDPLTMRKCFKYFSLAKHSDEDAKNLAISFRESLMNDFIKNHGYTERHGK